MSYQRTPVDGTYFTDERRTEQDFTVIGKVSVGSRRVNAYVSTLVTPTYVTGTLPAYNGLGANFLTSTAAAIAMSVDPRRGPSGGNSSGLSSGTSSSKAMKITLALRIEDWRPDGQS